MKKLITTLLSALCVAGVSAQDNCYFPTRKGAELSYKYYNARGKAIKDQWKNERWMKFKVEDVWPGEDGGMVINVGIGNETIERMAKSRTLSPVAENLSYGDVKIEGDRVTLDNIQWLAEVTPEWFTYMLANETETSSQYEVNLMAQTSFPRNMSVGQELPDEEILNAKYKEILTQEQQAERDKQMQEMKDEMKAITASVGGAMVGGSFGDFSISAKGNTRNRKVEAFEKVETPAGTFDCYKITYELVVPTGGFGGFIGSVGMNFDPMMGGGFPQQQEPDGVKYADWISPEVGLVKREKYNGRGKLQEVMRLEAYTK